MARSRMIRPEFWSDERIGNLSYLERLLFMGSWTFADDEGLCRANPRYLRSVIFPYDQTKESEIRKALTRLQESGLIFLYKTSGQEYLWIVKFRVYQRIDKPQKPTNPSPSILNGAYHKAIHRRDGYKCHICHAQCADFQLMGSPPDPRVASIDHLVPISKAGGDYPTNLKTACISCNKSRGNKDLAEFLKEQNEFQECSGNIPRTFNAETETEVKQKQKQKNTLDHPDGAIKRAKGDFDLLQGDFDLFWKAYPRKIGKEKAFSAWRKSNGKRPEIEAILATIEALKRTSQWLDEGGRYIPHPTTWINRGGWHDEAQKPESEIERWKREHGLP